MKKLIAGIVSSGLLLAGCGGGNSVKNATKQLSQAEQLAKGLASGNKDLDAFAAQAEKAKSAVFHAEYTVKQSGDETTIVVSQKPPKSRYTLLDASGTETSSMINDGKDTYSCFGSGTQAKCLKDKGSGGADSSLAGLTTLLNPAAMITALKAFGALAGIDVKSSTRKVAGQDVSCVTVTDKSKSSPEVDTYCTTKDGVLALMESSGDTFTLTKYTSSVSDSEFQVKGQIVSDASQLITPTTDSTDTTETTETTETTASTTTTTAP